MKKILTVLIIFFSLLSIRNVNIANAVSPTPTLRKPPPLLALCSYIKDNSGNWVFRIDWTIRLYQDGIRDYQVQAFDSSNNTWYANKWLNESVRMFNGFDIYPVPADRVISGRYRSTSDYSNISPWSDYTAITCSSSQPTPTRQPTATPLPTYTPTPTLTPSLTPTPTSTPTPWPTRFLARPPAPQASCSFNEGRHAIRWSWPNQPGAIDYWIQVYSYQGDSMRWHANTWTRIGANLNFYITDNIPRGVPIIGEYSWTTDHRSISVQSEFTRITCLVPTATPTPTPTLIPMPDLKIDSVTIINGEPEAVVSNIGELSAIFVNFPSVKVVIHCRDTNNNYIRNCSQKSLINIQQELNAGQSMTVRLPRLSANMVYYQANVESVDLPERTLDNNSLPMMRVPVPTATPTPTSSPLPDLKIESITFDAKTRAPTMKIKNNERAARAIFSNTRGGYVTTEISWRNSSDYPVGTTRMNIPPDRILEPGETMTISSFGNPPFSAVSYSATINLPTVLDESNTDNNGKFGDLPAITPTPTSTARLPTATTIPSNTPIPNITSPTPTPLDKKQTIIQNLAYPITELGNCKNKEDCANYCDIPANLNACNEFSVKTGLMTREEAERIRNATQVKSGPGGCNNQESCASYCDRPENLSVCLDYAEKNNLMSADELDKSKKVLAVLSSGAKTPGDCKTPKACQQYCSGGGPKIEECVSFAKGAGLIAEDEASQVREGEDFLKNGGPGGCKSRQECESYCENENHQQECETFFKNAGIPDSQPRDKSGKPPKTGGGPLCTTLEECKTFCANPANAEACKNVVMKENQASGPTIKGNTQELLQNINQMPQESKECLKQALGAETFEKLMRGETLTTPINGDVMQSCFAKGVEEYEKKVMPTKKPEDSDIGSPPPSKSSEVQGATTKRSLLDIILEWFRR